jgi:CDP-paratose 2-epimerase
MKKLLVTGSSGLIGSEVCLYFANQGWAIHGIDNNQRAIFFGSQGDTRSQQKRLETQIKGFVHHEIDVRDRPGILDLIDSLRKACDRAYTSTTQPRQERQQFPLMILISML